MAMGQMTNKLGLQSLGNRTWYVQDTRATQGAALCEGPAWLLDELSKC